MTPLFKRLLGRTTAVVLLAASSARAELPQAEYFQPPAASSGTELAAAQPTAPGPAGPTWEQYQSLVERLDANERKIAELRSSPNSAAPIVDPKRVVADGNPPVASPEQRIGALEKALGVKDTSPTFPSVRLSGFFHLDEGWFGQDAASRATLGDIQDGVGFRRARLQALGSVAEFTNYSIEMDFATAGRPSFMDVWGEQTHVPVLGNVRIGQYRQPYSMDALTSVRQLEFLERSLPFQAFDPFRRVGLMAYDQSDGKMSTWAYGIYRTGGFGNADLGDTRFATDIGDNGGISGVMRATHLLYYDEPADGRYLLHIGGSYGYSRATGGTAGTPFYQSRVIPEFFVGDPAGGGATAAGTPFFADTGRLASNSFQVMNAQLAGQYGAVHFQAEYMANLVDQIGAGQCYYDGAYAQVGWFLTGEHRTYNRMWGTFDRVNPYSEFFSLGRDKWFCGWGAWELVGRWSYVNLNSPNAAPIVITPGVPPSPDPGRLNNLTLGMNWIWNAYAKVQFNYIYCMLDNAAAGNSDTSIYCTRFEVQF
ncbi:MAG: hypothetical protein JNL96_28355 [Planctomycetaceae bacterium]|nr:hypothetical protein [Planctomycetaceae bacterium]